MYTLELLIAPDVLILKLGNPVRSSQPCQGSVSVSTVNLKNPYRENVSIPSWAGRNSLTRPAHRQATSTYGHTLQILTHCWHASNDSEIGLRKAKRSNEEKSEHLRTRRNPWVVYISTSEVSGSVKVEWPE
jgi:hypothetical protein